MPFSQSYIPFSCETSKQAIFIAEGLDQIHGCFYTLTVLFALLGHSSPFKQNNVNGVNEPKW
jgi:isoleucyl-tRNA synthetase